MKELNELLAIAERADAYGNLMNANPHKILAIAEAFRALKQENILLKQGCENSPLVHEMVDWRERAEAAEAQLAELNDEAAHERNLRSKFETDCKLLQAKLAELEKQRNPDYFLNRIESSDKWGGPEVELRIYESQLDASKSQDDHGGGIIELFTRPAPAADLAELVPPEMTWQDSNNMAEVAGFNECRDIILRNIEEVKK